MIIHLTLILFLVIGTVSDLRKRTLPIMLFAVFGLSGIVINITAGQVKAGLTVNWLFGFVLGIVFIAISLISDKKLGMGDALAILVTGIYLGGNDSALAVLYAMMVASLFSIVFLVLKKGSGKTELPFMPFLLTGCILQQIGALI